MVHVMWQRLRILEVNALESTLAHVTSSDVRDDSVFVEELVRSAEKAYAVVDKGMSLLYDRYGLRYDADPNPFPWKDGMT